MKTNDRADSPTRVPALPASDLRRAISRPTWLANRARNALQRPAFIGAISVATFVTAIVSLVVVPRTQRQTPPAIKVAPRPDTLGVLANAAMARLRLVQAESALVATRQAASTAASAQVAQTAIDSLARTPGPTHDSLTARANLIASRLAQAEQAPLPASYRALAEVPELQGDARVRALVDSLRDIEREREGFGAVGGVDPIFVALTSRANDVGRALRSIAEQRLAALRAQLGDAPAVTAAPVVAATPQFDTVPRIAERDSLRTVIQQSNDSLARLRAIAQQLDRDEDRAREQATRVAPPLALLASAFVLSAVFGFAAALIGELRRPRVSNAAELERFLGVRVLSTVETAMPSMDRGRREADRAAPPYFDPGAEAYQLAYLGLATEHPAVLAATITGDDRQIAAVVACNLAAVAADEARNTLVIDAEPACSASAALRARVAPGLTDVVRNNTSWTDARVSARVGRDKTVDLVPFGLSSPPADAEIVSVLERDQQRLIRYYDAIFALADTNATAAGIPRALASSGVVYCARPGSTPLHELREQLQQIRDGGGVVRGIVLWDAERPLLPTPRELASRPKGGQRRPEPALATT